MPFTFNQGVTGSRPVRTTKARPFPPGNVTGFSKESVTLCNFVATIEATNNHPGVPEEVRSEPVFSS